MAIYTNKISTNHPIVVSPVVKSILSKPKSLIITDNKYKEIGKRTINNFMSCFSSDQSLFISPSLIISEGLFLNSKVRSASLSLIFPGSLRNFLHNMRNDKRGPTKKINVKVAKGYWKK